MSHAADLAAGERFAFGDNWRDFLRRLDDHRIQVAQDSLRRDLDVIDLQGRTFLDIGCGSGLFSLAARRLGATVHSFDYDPASVACALELRRRYFPDDPRWTVAEASALDEVYLRSLGTFDVVYSWGVLHHTGDMWTALSHAALPVAADGCLFIAIYNECGRESARWRRIKKRYNSLPQWLRPAHAALAMAPYEAKDLVRALIRGRPGEYIRSWTKYDSRRGMSRWHDIKDWVGGYPYEVASVPALLAFYQERGFRPQMVREAGGLGCHELVLRRGAR